MSDRGGGGAVDDARAPGGLGSRPLWWMGCAFAAGAAAGARDPAAVGSLAAMLLAPLAAALLSGRAAGGGRGAARPPLPRALLGWALTAFAAGLVTAGLALARLEGLAPPAGHVTLVGRVLAVEPGAGGVRVLLSIPGVAGRVAAELPPLQGGPAAWPLPGDELTVSGRLNRPRAPRNPFGFDERRHWYSRGVGLLLGEARLVARRPGGWRPGRALIAWRHQALLAMREGLSPATSGLLAALLFGDRSTLDDRVDDDFRRAGVAHLLAVSGMHVGLLVGMAIRLAGRLGVRSVGRWLLSAAAAALYAAAAGAGPPVNRAAAGTALLLAAPILGRPVDGLNLLGAAALIGLVTEPLAILDLRFRLSFLAMVGLILCTDRLYAVLPTRVGPAALWRGIAAGVGAQLVLVPLLAASFTELAWAGPLTTVLLMPPLVLLLGAGALWTALASACGGCAAELGPLVEAPAWVLRTLAAAAGSAAGPWTMPSPPGWWAALYYLVVLALAADWRTPLERRRRREPGAASRLALLAPALAALVLVWTAWSAPRGLEVVFLDVGQGDAVVLGVPGGTWAVVDTGRTGRETVQFLRARGVRRLAWIAVTHAHADHQGGVERVHQLDPEAPVVVSPVHGGSLPGRLPAVAAGVGDALALGAVRVEVRGPPAEAAGWSTNDRSLVLRLGWAGWWVLLAGDAERAAETALLRAPGGSLHADVLKVAHHGSSTSTGADFLEAVRPALAVIQVGEGNGYGHPHDEVLARLREARVALLRTDRDGAVWIRFTRRVMRLTVYGPEGARTFEIRRGPG